mgnify:CR=1 FL=1
MYSALLLPFRVSCVVCDGSCINESAAAGTVSAFPQLIGHDTTDNRRNTVEKETVILYEQNATILQIYKKYPFISYVDTFLF